MLRILKTNIENKTTIIDNMEKDCWIDLTNPSPDEIELVSYATGLDSTLLEAALDKEESSRIEVEKDQILIILDVPIMDIIKTNAIYSTIPLGIILNNDFIVTVALEENNIVDDFYEQKIKTFYTNKKSRFILQLLLRIDKYYLSFLKQIYKSSNNIQKNLYKSLENQELLDLIDIRKSLIHFSTSLKANQTVIERILKLNTIKKIPEDEYLLDDIIIENSQAIEMAETYIDILSSFMRALRPIINNNLKTTMKKLTIIVGVLFVPLTLILFYSMNVPLPLNNSNIIFIGIGGISIIAFIMIAIIIKRKI